MSTPTSGFKDFAEKPDKFSGKDVEKFIRSVRIFIKANDTAFTTDDKKILFTLSCMKEGSANEWAQNYTDSHLDDDNWGTFDNFLKLLRQAFGDPNEAKDAQHRLESFKQGTLTASEFFAKFEIYRRKAKYLTKKENVHGGHDDYLIAVLERNLDPSLIRRIYAGDTVPSSYETYKDKVLSVYAMEQRFRSLNLRPARPIPPMPVNRSLPPQPLITTSTQPTSTSTPHSGDRKDSTGITFGGAGQPMQIDREEARKRGLCFRCGQPGHRSFSCPTFQKQRQQIRSLLADLENDEWDDVLIDLDTPLDSVSDFPNPQL